MEFLLMCWDELDDAVALCRHVSRTVIDELASVGAPFGAWAAAVSRWRRMPARNPLPVEDPAR
jgi:hypothetical protein